MKVAILGSGPAGLIAADTCEQEGITDITILTDLTTNKGKSPIGGAQYLHCPLSDGQEPDGEIEFVKVGDPAGYRDKIYTDFDTGTSWEDYDGVHLAWSLRPLYDNMFAKWRSHMRNKIVHGLEGDELAAQYDVVLSTIPAHALCVAPNSHPFPKVPIVLAKWSPLRMDNVVMYSGRDSDPWYRTSRIFGEGWTEYGAEAIAHGMDPRVEDDPDIEMVYGFKPLGTDCPCNRQIKRIGRFGNWDRKVLLHHVPDQVRAVL